MEQKDKNQLYAICKHKETDVYHVFLTRKGEDKKCYFSSDTSICGDMQKSDIKKCIIACVTKEQIQQKAANIDDTVCGNCMKSIYKTED